MKLILGTASKQRRDVFEKMGYKEFEVLAADIDERVIRLEDPKELTIALAKAKAKAIMQRIDEPAILITADQVISWANTIREKPQSREEAKEFLMSYHQVPAFIVNGVVVTNTESGKQAQGNDYTKVVFDKIPEDVAEEMVEELDVFTWAGGFAVKEPAFKPYIKNLEGLAGSSRGLPEKLTKELIAEVS